MNQPESKPIELDKQVAKKDALTLVNAAVEVLEKNPWKTRQDQRAANKAYTYLLAAQKALEDANIEMVPVAEEPTDGNQ